MVGRQESVLNFFLSVWCMKNIVFKKQNTWLLAAFFSNIFFALGYSHRPCRWQSDPAVSVPGEGSNPVNSVYGSPRTPISVCSMTSGSHLGCICFNGKVGIIQVGEIVFNYDFKVRWNALPYSKCSSNDWNPPSVPK